MASKRPSGDYNQSGIAAGMSKGATRGLTDSDVSGLVEVRENNVRQFQDALDQAIVTSLEEVGLNAGAKPTRRSTYMNQQV
ncbi:MAG: hypothetical protein PUE49_06375 [Eggerthellales bacterium]|nr:hypothetical protein [Eggerthellales bacterium]